MTEHRLISGKRAAVLGDDGALHGPAIQRRAQISTCGLYRWTLERLWDASAPLLCVVMLNPSTADGSVDDPTIRRLTRWAMAWGYGGYTVVNLYPLRASNPAAVREWVRWADRAHDRRCLPLEPVFDANDRVIRQAAASCDDCLVAWGAGAWEAPRVRLAVEAIWGTRGTTALLCLGTTAGGAPTHPMARGRHRVPDDVRPTQWRSPW